MSPPHILPHQKAPEPPDLHRRPPPLWLSDHHAPQELRLAVTAALLQLLSQPEAEPPGHLPHEHQALRSMDYSTDPILTGLTETLAGLKQGSVPLTLMNATLVSLTESLAQTLVKSRLSLGLCEPPWGIQQLPGHRVSAVPRGPGPPFCQGPLALHSKVGDNHSWRLRESSNSVVHAETRIAKLWGAGARNHWDPQPSSGASLTGGPQLSLLLMAKCVGGLQSPSKRGKREGSSLLT